MRTGLQSTDHTRTGHLGLTGEEGSEIGNIQESRIQERLLSLKNGTDRLPRNVGKNNHYTLRSSPEQRSSFFIGKGKVSFVWV